MAKEAKDLQLWNNVNGKMLLFTNEHISGKGKAAKKWLSYSTSVGKKNDSGEYKNIYFDVIFKKDETPGDLYEIGEVVRINVKKGFLTASVYRDGSVHNAVMVMDYEMLD